MRRGTGFPNLLEIIEHDRRPLMLLLVGLYFLAGWAILIRFLKPRTWAELAGVLALGVAWNIA